MRAYAREEQDARQRHCPLTRPVVGTKGIIVMKVVLCTDSLDGGGAERQLIMLASQLERRGVDVTLLTFYPRKPFYMELLQESGVRHVVDESGVSPLGRIRAIRRAARQMRADAVVAFKNGTAMAACLAGFHAPWRTVVSERNVTVDLTFRERAKFLLYRMADAVVCNSRAQHDFIEKNFPELSGKTTVIHNLASGISRSAVGNVSSAMPSVLTVARIAPQKDVSFYLHLARRLADANPSVRFRWIGDAVDAGYMEEMLSLRSALNLDGIVEFLPASENIAGHYARATHFLLASRHEGFSNALCEAVVAELTCVASDVGDNALILGNRGLVFPSGDLDAAASTLQAALDKPVGANPVAMAMMRGNVDRLTDRDTIISQWIETLDS